MEILKNAFASGKGVFYNVNLTKNQVQGKVYQVVENKKYCINDLAGLPENPEFSAMTAYWGSWLSGKEREAYFSFFELKNLLEHYEKGEDHVTYTYWTRTAVSEKMYAEQHIVMYRDEENGDILAVSYLLDLTEQVKSSMKLNIERRFLEVICRDYTTVHYANLEQDIAEPLKVGEDANASKISQIKLRQTASYTESVTYYCEQYIADKDKKEFLRVMDRAHLLEELSKADRFVFRYESIPNMAGHRYFEVQVVRIKEDNFDGSVIVAFHHIDDIVSSEQKYQMELEQLAYRDALTNMGNRAAFTKELSACGQCPTAACVVSDVNNLKWCNDRYGHQEGDRMIQDAAECMCRAFEEFGRCYRIGGDEFCVLIPEGEEARIREALYRLEELIAQKNRGRVMPLSIACGYAVREGLQEDMERLFNRSDEMMYDVKYKMKKQFPVYCEERIKNYLNVLEILSKSTDSYLYLWNIGRDESWFFGPVDHEYALRDKGKSINTIAEMEAIIYPADRQMLHEDLQLIIEGKKQVHDMNYRWVNRQGEAVWINCRGRVIPDDKGNPFVMIGRVSDKSLRYLYHPLTKLFNKNKLMQDLKDSLFGENKGYFMLLGIDNLDNLNLKHGRNYGDEVIKQCAEILEKTEIPQHIWHVENNCFALYLAVESVEEVKAVYDRLQSQLAGICTLSAGVVPNSRKMFGNEAILYDCAELTLTKAKNTGLQTILFFSQEDLEKRLKATQFLEEMQESIKNNCKGFYLCYQPQVKTGNYQLYAAEALLRYHSEVQGDVYPNEFIPLLEQSKLIHQVGMWTLETALLQCKQWRKTMLDFRISVNFSAVQLMDREIAEKVLDVLAKTEMPGEALTIELTESTQLQGTKHFSEIFRRWRDAGIEISIDDFGTGYASMSYLKDLDVNEIKIDRMFVRGVEEATYNYRLISNMIEFAKNNAIRICCEGVEDVRELTVLEGLSPNLIQGYLFAKPCKKEAFEQTFINRTTEEYREQAEFVQRLYQYKDKMHVIYFNTKDILRKTDLGLWIIRINKQEQYYEMHVDETMERLMSVDRKYTPQECYDFWFSRIKEGYRDYVEKNVNRMIEAGKVVQLQYPWIHPVLGEVMVRCNGIRVEDSDGMITLEGYHRMIQNIEQTEAQNC